MTILKQDLCNAIETYVNKRSGMSGEIANYINEYNGRRDVEGRKAYAHDCYTIKCERSDALKLLNFIRMSPSIEVDEIISGINSSFSGRLQITTEGAEIKIDYCVGQYWPTEYRRAVCVGLGQVIRRYTLNKVLAGEFSRNNYDAYVKKHYMHEFNRRCLNSYITIN